MAKVVDTLFTRDQLSRTGQRDVQLDPHAASVHVLRLRLSHEILASAGVQQVHDGAAPRLPQRDVFRHAVRLVPVVPPPAQPVHERNQLGAVQVLGVPRHHAISHRQAPEHLPQFDEIENGCGSKEQTV